MESLKEKTARGIFWGGMNNGVQQVIGLAFGIILGRLLSPSDYGMMAMISIFSLIATTLQNSGFTVALTNLKEPTHRDYNSVFWFNIIVGVSMYLILFFCAPLIADYYHTESITPLCRYAFLSIVIASFGTAQSARLFKNLMVKQQAMAGMTAVICSSAVGAAMAWSGWAYWSLATQGLVFVGINTVMVWYFSHWRPTFDIDFGPVCKMFRFSCKVLATAITTNINNNVLNILLGHYFTAHETGNYNQAYQWNSKCFNLVQGMVNQVAQPVLVDLREDKGRQLNAFRKMVRFTAFISFPLMLGLGLISREFIIIAITKKWLASALLLQILCVSGAVMPLCSLMSNMIISKGRSGIYFWCTFSLGLSQIVLMVLIWHSGMRFMVIAYTVINVLWLFVWHYFTYKLTNYSIAMLLRDILPFAFSALGVMVITYYATLQITNLYILLLLRMIIAATLYYAIMRLAHVKILDECQTYIISKIKKP